MQSISDSPNIKLERVHSFKWWISKFYLKQTNIVHNFKWLFQLLWEWLSCLHSICRKHRFHEYWMQLSMNISMFLLIKSTHKFHWILAAHCRIGNPFRFVVEMNKFTEKFSQLNGTLRATRRGFLLFCFETTQQFENIRRSSDSRASLSNLNSHFGLFRQKKSLK